MFISGLCYTSSRNILMINSNIANVYRTISYYSKICPLLKQNYFLKKTLSINYEFYNRKFASNIPKTKNLYDILEISPKATTGQIKKAYYKLSKDYHPDLYKGGDAKDDFGVKRFREVNEAYEILGNLQKRRMYDKGLFNYSIAATPKEAEDFAAKIRKTQASNLSSGKTPIFDFEDWSKQQYSRNFEKSQESKRAKVKHESQQQVSAKGEYLLFVAGFVFIFIYSSFQLK